MLHVERLRLLREVVHRGTIASTARALGLTPSAVSQQLSALEREAGVALLERHNRGIVPTAAGRMLVERTTRVLSELEAAAAELERFAEEVRGVVRLAAVSSAAVTFVAVAVAAVKERHPHLDVRVATAEPEAALADLELGDVEVAVVDVYDYAPEPFPEGVVATELLIEPLVVVAPPGRVSRRRVALRALADDAWVMAPESAACGRAVRLACRQAGFEPRVTWETDDLELFHRIVAAGHGVAVLPQLAVLDASDVDVCRLADVRLLRTLTAVTRSGTAGRPAVAAVVDALVEAAPAAVTRRRDRPQAAQVFAR